MRLGFLLALVFAMLTACGGGHTPSVQPTARVTVDPAIARVNVDTVVARVGFTPGPEAFGPESSISWTLSAKPARSAAMLNTDPAVLEFFGVPGNPQTPTGVVLSPDVAGTYTLQATVNYGSGLSSVVGRASVTAVHSMSFSVVASSAESGIVGSDVPPPDGGTVFSPSAYLRTWVQIRSDARIGAVEAFVDGQSLGRLTEPNMTLFFPGQHGIPGGSLLTYGHFIPKTQVLGTHSLRWVVTGESGSGITGEGTLQIGETGGPLTSFGPFSGNP
jgi:hypothetical protein